MSEIVDLSEERNKRAEPDPEFVRKDEYGRKLYKFTLSYAMDDKRYCTSIWAYDEEEAMKRVEAMRVSLTYDGQIFAEIPA